MIPGCSRVDTYVYKATSRTSEFEQSAHVLPEVSYVREGQS